jgi:hypothetical protein
MRIEDKIGYVGLIVCLIILVIGLIGNTINNL